MPMPYKLVGIGLSHLPEPESDKLPSLKLLWPLLEGPSDGLPGLRCLKSAATNATPAPTATLSHVPSDVVSQIVKIVSPSDSRLNFVLALALLRDGTVIYLSSSKRFHLKRVEFVVDGGATEDIRCHDIAAGATHFLACDTAAHAWVWGWGNEWGQFGVGTIWKAQSVAEDQQGASKDEVAIARTLTFFRGDIISEDSIAIVRPQRIKAFGKAYGRAGVAAVAAGRYHSIFLADNKKGVFTCGWGEVGQLGQGESVQLTPTPKSILRLFGCSVAAIAAASTSDHTHLLLESGKVLAFGDNTSGVLGTGKRGCEWSPARMAFHTSGSAGLASIKDACVNNVKNYTAAQAPYGSPESFLYPRRVQQLAQSLSPGEPATDVLTTSATHTFLRASDGTLYSCGQRPVRVVSPLSVINVDAVGALGRYISLPEEGLILEEPVVEAGPSPLPIAGQGFTLFIDGTGQSYKAYFVGAIADNRGRVLLASGVKGSPSSGSLAIGFDGLVKNAFPVFGGALAIVQV